MWSNRGLPGPAVAQEAGGGGGACGEAAVFSCHSALEGTASRAEPEGLGERRSGSVPSELAPERRPYLGL